MKPDPAAPADQTNLLRQQLILAQVRIMELEDTRDELTPRLSQTEKLLTAAQALADQKIAEAGHLAQVRSDLQAQYEHMRHMQHVTNEALNASRADAAAIAAREQALLGEVEQLQVLIRQLAESERKHLARAAELELELASARTESTGRLDRINQLEAERKAMKASRSWRWTAWLRSFERTFRGKP